MAETRDCLDCEQEKHQGCLGKVFDNPDPFDENGWVPCPCAERGHLKKSTLETINDLRDGVVTWPKEK